MTQNGQVTPVQERSAEKEATRKATPRVEGPEVPLELLLDLVNLALQTDPGRALWRGFVKYGLQRSETLRLVINSADIVAAAPPG